MRESTTISGPGIFGSPEKQQILSPTIFTVAAICGDKPKEKEENLPTRDVELKG